MMDWEPILKSLWTWLITTGPRLLLIIVLTLIALPVVKLLVIRLVNVVDRGEIDIETQKRLDTLRFLIRNILNVVIITVAGVMVLGQFGINIGPLLAAAGIVGVAVGFGAQHLVQDIISGFFILIEDQVRVGDVIQAAGKGGVVERVSLRMTRLRDLSGNVHFIPNSKIDVVTNMTKEYSYYLLNIGVAYREDVDEVIEVVKQIDEELRKDSSYADLILAPIEILGLDEFADSAIIVKARIKTLPIKQWFVGREFNRRMKKRFDDLNIEIPFPHVTLYMGEGKDGSAPPARVALVEGGRVQSAPSK